MTLKGFKHSEETKRKMRLVSIGKKKSEEHKKNIGLAQIGNKHSEESKIKMSLARKGKKWSEEMKIKMSKSHKGLFKGSKNPAWKGGRKPYYGRIANQVYREFHLYVICEECGTSEDICIHHRDTNKKNNQISNLQALCRSCHMILHRKLQKQSIRKIK